MGSHSSKVFKRILTFVIALTMIVSIIPMGSAQAAQAKNGLRKSSNGYYYCYKNGSKVKKSGWVAVNSNLKVKLGSTYKVQYKQTKKGSKTYISKFVASKKKFVRLDKTVITLSDKKLHYVGKGGVLVRKQTTVKDSKGNVYFLEKGGIVSKRYVKKSQKLYKYNHGTKKWSLMKNTSCKIDGKTYYFDKNGKRSTKTADTQHVHKWAKDHDITSNHIFCNTCGADITKEGMSQHQKETGTSWVDVGFTKPDGSPDLVEVYNCDGSCHEEDVVIGTVYYCTGCGETKTEYK